jgi:hypothetical protein
MTKTWKIHHSFLSDEETTIPTNDDEDTTTPTNEPVVNEDIYSTAALILAATAAHAAFMEACAAFNAAASLKYANVCDTFYLLSVTLFLKYILL